MVLQKLCGKGAKGLGIASAANGNEQNSHNGGSSGINVVAFVGCCERFYGLWASLIMEHHDNIKLFSFSPRAMDLFGWNIVVLLPNLRV